MATKSGATLESMQHPLTEKNYKPLTSLASSGYTVSVEIGDLVQDTKVWHEQVLRVTIVDLAGDIQWKVFRGSKARGEATKWIQATTAGAIDSI